MAVTCYQNAKMAVALGIYKYKIIIKIKGLEDSDEDWIVVGPIFEGEGGE